MKRLLTSCFGLGRLPLAPGTWGSLPAAVIFIVFIGALDAPAAVVSLVMAALVLAGSFICIRFASVAVAATGKTDPAEIVADELAGQALTFLAVPFLLSERGASSQIWAVTFFGFLLFRVFDISKPWPIRKLEKLPGGWGILADDLAAGAYAAVALILLLQTGTIDYVAGLITPAGDSLSVPSAIILGAVQGLTEFLPVSSSGHLVLLETLFGLDAEQPRMLLFDLSVHLGTLAAIFVVFHNSIAGFLKGLAAAAKYGKGPVEIYKRNPAIRLLVLAVTATAITGVIGIAFEHYFQTVRGSLMVVAGMWLINGTLLLAADRRRRTHRGLRQFGIAMAVIIGLAQAAAIAPGISRSGATIAVAVLMGLRRRWAVEFSFLIAIPAILGAAIIKFAEGFGEIGLMNLPVGAVLAGAVTAAITGVIALRLLISASRRARLKIFALYCYILAACVAGYLLSNR